MKIKATFIKVVPLNGMKIIKIYEKPRYFENKKGMDKFRLRAIRFLSYIYKLTLTLNINHEEYK